MTSDGSGIDGPTASGFSTADDRPGMLPPPDPATRLSSYDAPAMEPYLTSPVAPYGEPPANPYGAPPPNPYATPSPAPYGATVANPYDWPAPDPYAASPANPYAAPATGSATARPLYLPPPPKPAKDSTTKTVWVGALIVLFLFCTIFAHMLRVTGTTPSGTSSSEAGEWVDWLDMRAGLCFNISDVNFNGHTRGVRSVACTAPHSAEVAGHYSYTLDEYPGDEQAGALAGSNCNVVVARYMGSALTSDSPRLRGIFIRPDKTSWTSESKAAVCLVATPDDQPTLTGSVQGSAVQDGPWRVEPWHDLLAGECYGGGWDIYYLEMPVVSCGIAHAGEVIGTYSLSSDSYPSEYVVMKDAAERCAQELDAYASPEVIATLRVGPIFPARNLWEAGYLDVICLVEAADEWFLFDSVRADPTAGFPAWNQHANADDFAGDWVARGIYSAGEVYSDVFLPGYDYTYVLEIRYHDGGFAEIETMDGDAAEIASGSWVYRDGKLLLTVVEGVTVVHGPAVLSEDGNWLYISEYYRDFAPEIWVFERLS